LGRLACEIIIAGDINDECKVDFDDLNGLYGFYRKTQLSCPAERYPQRNAIL